MSSIIVNIPDSLLSQVEVLATKEHNSIEQFALLAIAEKVSSLATVDYIAQRAGQANLERFDALLAKIPLTEPQEYDKL